MKPLSDIEQNWSRDVIRPEEITRYLDQGRDFIDDPLIERLISGGRPDPGRVRDILAKSLNVETLTLEETACLLSVTDPLVLEKMYATAAEVKTKVYDNRVVTFAPLYVSNLCVNNCAYCGFRRENSRIKRGRLSMDDVRRETSVLAGSIGHKRLIAVFGEHPLSDAGYICSTMQTIYGVREKVREGWGQIRRVNVNAAPLSVADFKAVKDAGIGTYQVFQETYHHRAYESFHPSGTVKGDYRWRLYSLHRAMEAGIDDVAIGALFGLHDWKFEVMAMVSHARDLERQFGIGPHTVSVPRLEPAADTPFNLTAPARVSDADFKKLICVLRLAVPYAGMIITCRERPEFIREVIPMCTQRDASTRIGVGAYRESYEHQQEERQQFMLGDTRSLTEVVRELAAMGYITSFCTAGYRCGRTGKNIMTLLKTGREGCFCKLNAILTFREWLLDFADSDTRATGEALINKEIEEVRRRVPVDFTRELFDGTMRYLERIRNGERDLCF